MIMRQSQMVRSSGPGAMVDMPTASVLVAGLDHWSYPAGDHRQVEEPRLLALLRHMLGLPDLTLRRPPPSAPEGQKGSRPSVGVFRFPGWCLVQRDDEEERQGEFRRRRLVHWDGLDNGKWRGRAGKRLEVVPVRFVRACRFGHLGDIDWPAFVHGSGSDCHRDLWMEERGTSGDLNEVWVVCECGADRAMSQAARRGLHALGDCDGARPWLGAYSREHCTEQNRLLIRSASNAYFPQSLSVISIPDPTTGIDAVVRAQWEAGLSAVQDPAELAFLRRMPTMAAHLAPFTDSDILAAIERAKAGSTGASGSVKELEFEALTAAQTEIGTDRPDGDFYARALPPQVWQTDRTATIERVVLVHRLREVVAQVGFTRFEASAPDVNGDLDLDVRPAPLALNARWLPAIENRGEGVFLKFRAEAIDAWLGRTNVILRGRELDAGHATWRKDHQQSTRPFPGMPYIMLHSLSHLLITSIALDCGYPASSLRERIFAADGRYGILLFTGSSDADGTLGGLVEAGRQIKRHMQRALQMAALCSNDPICATHEPTGEDRQALLGSACHGCLLISETSCEQRNDYLDRSLLVPTLADLGAEFFGAIE
jgi:hypothetical protein